MENIGEFLLSMGASVLGGLVILVIEHFLVDAGTKRWWQRWLLISVVLGALSAAVFYRAQQPRKAWPVLADFDACRPINNYGWHWDVFNDNPWNGNSSVMITSVRAPVENGSCYVKLVYRLGDRSTIPPYTGIYTYFSRPAEPRDISRFGGVQLHSWTLSKLPSNVHVYLQLRPDQMIDWNDGYFEYDLTQDITHSTKESVIRVPFDHFSPSPPLRKTGFNGNFGRSLQQRVFGVSIVIRGTEGGKTADGEIGLDEIEFF